MIYLRYRRHDQPDFDYYVGAWIVRPELAGPNATVRVADDSKLQSVLDRAHAEFGMPGAVLHIPDRLPTPSAQSLKNAKGNLK